MNLSRRNFMVAAASAAALAGVSVGGATSANAAASVTPAEALRRLERGNTRSVNGNFKSKNYSPLASTPAKGQKPFAAILTCGDSRTDPDFIFDMAPGNLFVVRNAGNVLESVGLGSLEFAAAVLGVSVIAVIGHTECGAVIATEGSVKTGEMPGPHLDSFVDLISPAVEALPAGHSTNDSIAANASYQARQIQSQSSTIANLTATGDVGIVSGVYGLASGRVTWLQT
jgi:carbonic anhydrase